MRDFLKSTKTQGLRSCKTAILYADVVGSTGIVGIECGEVLEENGDLFGDR